MMEASFIRRRVRRRNSSTNTIMTMGNRLKLLVAGSMMMIGALFWAASGVVGRGGHLRGRGGSFVTDAAVDDKAPSSRIHPRTQPFVSYFENLRLLLSFIIIPKCNILCPRIHTHSLQIHINKMVE